MITGQLNNFIRTRFKRFPKMHCKHQFAKMFSANIAVV